ncbi:MAG: FUSC family protein [Nocardioides sp.]
MTTFWEERREWAAVAGRGRRDRLRDPLLWADLLQIAKTALAGGLAWWVATDVFHLDQPFLAPWSAVLVVHATLYRTFSRGAQQVAATFAGVFIAWGTGLLLGLGPSAMTAMLVLSFLVGRLKLLGEESTSVATTAIVVLATNAVGESNLLWGRLLDTCVGVAIGLVVNIVVWPPLRDRAAWSHASRLPRALGDLLVGMAKDIGPGFDPEHTQVWLGRARDVDLRIDQSWGLLRQAQESGRFNPRQRRRREHVDELETVLHLLEQAVAETQSMVRTIAISADQARYWDEDFRSRWCSMLADTGAAVSAADPERLAELRIGLQQLASDMSTDELASGQWHEYGGLIVNLRNVIDAVSRVAAPNPVAPRSLERWRQPLRRDGP